MKGVYFYKYAESVHPVLDLRPHAIPVEVMEQKGKRYRVRYLAKHMDGSAPGSVHWVQKRKVRVDAPPSRPDNIHLPYKDE